MTNFLLTGGGTAGHVNPLLTVASALVAKDSTNNVFVLGTSSGLESRLVPEAGFPLLLVDRLPFPRKITFSAITFPFRFLRSVSKVRKYLRQHEINAVVGFGGYVSAPAYLAAKQLKVPLILHEGNALPGIANRFGNRFASAAGKAFRSAQLSNTEFVGMPIRPAITALATKKDVAAARKYFGLKPDTTTLLVTGGSLGARSINGTIESSRALLSAAGIQVLHIIGDSSDLAEVSEPEYRRVRYVDQMELAIAASDFAVSRAGAATVSEFCAVGLPALYIPYAVGNGEQKFNLQDVLAAGGAITATDREFDEQYVRSSLIPVISDSKRLAQMSEAAKQAGVLDGTERFIALIEEVVSRR
jgi:UDP-N-acetylglucosamine--N-acetylmuramyl-(pentapeptide) pyrophosphoryl-undecaprenol N-acetylglucosamine transferase